MVVAAELVGVNRAELLGRMAGKFRRRESRQQAGKYVDGLMSELAVKNGWTLAERAADRTPDRMQRLLNRAVWDEAAAIGVVAQFVVEALHSPLAVVVLDESGQEKKGEHTAGVKRQYVGCAGRVANAVNVVYATYASPRGHAIVAARPYLPKDWAADPDRRQAAGVPAQVTFRTKPQLAMDILTDLHNGGLLPAWATGDEVYGRDRALREFCQDPSRDLGYVFEVPRSFGVTLSSHRRVRAEQALALVEAKDWNHRSAGPGSKGERNYLWAWIATQSPRHHLLIRRSCTDPTELAYFYTFTPAGRPVTLPILVRVAGMRWPVEEDFQTSKGHFGLDHSQVRLYTALLRHLTLSITALAICSVTAAALRQTSKTLAPPPTSPDDQPPENPGLIAFTVAEVRRLLNLATRTHLPARFHEWWSWWRRRHQARARWFHQRTRLQRQAQTT
jgi:SRSO17 transposase